MAGSRFEGSPPLMLGFGTIECADIAPLTLGKSQRTHLCPRDAADRTLRSESGAPDGVGVWGAGTGTGYVRVPDMTEGRSAMKDDHCSLFDLRLCRRIERRAKAVA
jgi:hypothetical protein